MKNKKKFLTLKEVKNLGLKFHKYSTSYYSICKEVYGYKKDDKWVLVQDGEVLISDVDWVYWFDKGDYVYTDGYKWVLVQDYEIVVSDVDWVLRYGKDNYDYMKNDKLFSVEGDKTREF